MGSFACRSTYSIVGTRTWPGCRLSLYRRLAKLPHTHCIELNQSLSVRYLSLFRSSLSLHHKLYSRVYLYLMFSVQFQLNSLICKRVNNVAYTGVYRFECPDIP